MKKKIKYLSLFIFLMCITPNVHAENFTCSALGDIEIDVQLAHIVKYAILAMQIVIPIILVVLGMIDLMKSVMAQKEDEIKKGQHIFMKRLIAGAIVFFVFAVVKFGISLVAGGSSDTILNCASCFIKGPDDSSCG